MRQVLLVAVFVVGFTVPATAADTKVALQAEAEIIEYATQIDAARQALERNNSNDVYEQLAKTLPKLRGWEHDYLFCQATRIKEEGQKNPLTLNRDGAVVESLAFTRDGRRLVVGYGQKVVKVWDLIKREPIDLVAGQRISGSVASSPDGKLFATEADGGDIFLWDAATSKILLHYKGHHLPADAPYGQTPLIVKEISFSPDSTQVVSVAYTATSIIHQKGEVKVWSVANGITLVTIKGPHENGPSYITTATFSPDGKLIATGGFDKKLKLWDAATGKEIRSMDVSANNILAHNILEIAFSPDGKRVATASADGTLAVWDVDSGTELLRLTGHTAPIFSVKFSPDGKRLVSGGWDRTVRIWNADTGTPLLTLGEMQGPVLSVALSWDGKRIAAGGGIYGYPERSIDATVWDSSFELNENR